MQKRQSGLTTEEGPMASKSVRVRRTLRWLVCAAVVGWGASAMAATHYPPGSLCYDCHAVSKAKMVVGTHLLKKSQKTLDLGITTASPVVRCLFCHESGAVSVENRTVMMGVWDHFDATSVSKHDADLQSTFTQDGSAFDCLDCHTGVSEGVVADGTGNATIHGVDASAGPLDKYGTLIGSPANDAALAGATCQNAACHGSIGSGGATMAGYTARGSHTIAGTTINDGSAPTSCTQCHGRHNSYKVASLVVLKTDGTTSNSLTEPIGNMVTPEKCTECHDADDPALGNPWVTDGHGRSDVGGGLACTACHGASVPHGFSASASGTNDMRFSLAFNPGDTSALTGKMTFSVCLTCHSTLAGKNHGPQNVGCLDCHDPHGKGVNANIMMVREQVPVAGATDTNAFVGSAGVPQPSDYVDWADSSGPGGTSAGLCDNRDCHSAGSGYTPAATYTTTASHGGGVLTSGTDCAGCHTHLDVNGSWGAGASCNNCHGFPPNSNAHVPHVTDKGFDCVNCHPGDGKANHNESGIADAVDFTNTYNSTPGAIRSNVQVDFTAATVYAGVGSYTLAPGSRNNTTTFGDCTTACHGGTLPVATRGTDTQPSWNVATSGDCGTCHRADAANPPGTGNHALHAGAAPNRAFGCQMCHAGTYDGANLLGSHVDGNSNDDLLGSGNFNGAVSFAYTSPDCSNLSCHGAYVPVAWGAAADNCLNCHGTFQDAGGMVASVVARHRNADWTNPDGNGLTSFGNNHRGAAVGTGKGEEFCDYCHANTQAVYTGGASPSYESARHIDGQIQVNSTMGYAGVSGADGGIAGCSSACHVQTAPYRMADSTFALEPLAGQGFSCGACHNDGTIPPTSGAHLAHRVDADTDYTECEACHGLPPNGVSSTGWAANSFDHNNGVVAFAGSVNHAPGALPNDPSDDTCSTTACHSAAPATATWGSPASLGCDECHYWAATPSSAGNSASLEYVLGDRHNAHFAVASGAKTCTACHADNGTDTVAPRTHVTYAGAGSDGVVLTSGANPVRDNALVQRTGMTFNDPNNTCSGGIVLGCHATGTPDWDVAGPLACTACHTNNTTTTVNPSSGLHNSAAATPGVTYHDETLGTGCTECHVAANIAAHQNGVLNGDNAAGALGINVTWGGTGVAYADAGTGNPTRGTCQADCHSDGGAWSREWSTNADFNIVANPNPGQAACNVCHGQYQTLPGSTGWRAGTVHFRSGSGAGENKGAIHMTIGANACEDCHGYDSVAVHNSNNAIDFSDGGTSTYTAVLNTTPDPDQWYCSACHDLQGSEDPANTSSHTFYDSLPFPNSKNSVDGATEPTGDCTASGCHDGTAGRFFPPTSNAHTTHVTTYPYGCDSCHPQDHDGTATDVTFAGGLSAGGTYTPGAMTCSTIYCHGGASPVGPRRPAATAATATARPTRPPTSTPPTRAAEPTRTTTASSATAASPTRRPTRSPTRRSTSTARATCPSRAASRRAAPTPTPPAPARVCTATGRPAPCGRRRAASCAATAMARPRRVGPPLR